MVHNHMLTDITTKEKCLKDINYQSGGRGGGGGGYKDT